MRPICENSHNNSESCYNISKELSEEQMNHLVAVIKQRYISPYKIIYMINPQQADYFKLRNQAQNCCSSSIAISKDQMTKTEIFLFQAITQTFKFNNLNKILEQLADKFDKIVKSGKKQNLKIDEQVQKFLLQKVLSEGFNLHLQKLVFNRLKKETEQISSSAMLWATPNTWYAKYPNISLNFLSSQTIIDLNNPKKGFGHELNFLADYKDNLYKQLRLLEQDGKFQEQIFIKEFSKTINYTKVLDCLQKFCFDGSEQFYREGQIVYPNLKRSLMTLKSISFQLNAKLNAYCTISQNNKVLYFKDSMIYRIKEDPKISHYSTYCGIGDMQINCKIIQRQSNRQKQNIRIKSGQLIIIDNQLCQIYLQSQGASIFLFLSWISTLMKKN